MEGVKDRNDTKDVRQEDSGGLFPRLGASSSDVTQERERNISRSSGSVDIPTISRSSSLMSLGSEPEDSRPGSQASDQVLRSQSKTRLAAASPRVPAGPTVACGGQSVAAVEVVGLGSSMSGREQQDESASGVGRHRGDGKNHLEAGSSGHKAHTELKCQQCDKTFKYKSLLEQHSVTHSGVKNHECLECGKRFTTKGELTRHTLTHSGVKNHECLECGKRFTQRVPSPHTPDTQWC
ncbi:Zinc finger protein 562 [Chionoecetes opilio]|uniref:Zinc finger protein 562 n=1 Tax=Chionoecetes opilio TaxID=41210 RepID=A0A8J4YQW2_CHIOP|nr:Zinc finger protein 562 [Chionoecetes opilio]